MRRDQKIKDFRREKPMIPVASRSTRPAEPDSGLIFGVLPVLEALKAQARRVEKVIVAEGVREHRLGEIFETARANSIAVDRIPREKFDRLFEKGVTHQGVAARTSAAAYADAASLIDKAGSDALLLLLDGIEDPRNLGAILRSAEGAGVGGVFIPERRAVGLNETVAKSSAGAVEHIPVAKVQNMNRLIEELKSRNIWVVGASGDAEQNYTDWDWTQPSALVLGNEGSGLHRLVAEKCDVLVKIPMYGKMGSLNVSVAAGVILFEAMRQRGKKS
ncbi:23S rRNA (guanosine(2251)-2'-O)-methyltransferase RlmB [soil metagenome]